MPRAPFDSTPLYAYDAAARALHGAPLLCGVDEAGRGPLCGPLAVGAVILDPQNPVPGVNDSKKLSGARREELYNLILQRAVAWQVVLISPADIDRLNILGAVLHGVAEAVRALSARPHLVLMDGDRVPPLPVPALTVKKGDALSACVAAASILAKVTRDRYMCRLDAEYPQYRLAKHKGYPTKEHYELLERYGTQDFYRRSFLKKRGL